MSSIFGSSGVRGFCTELFTASAIAGSQRCLLTASESLRAEPVTAAPPYFWANSSCTLLEVNHSRNCTAPSGFLDPEETLAMKVPIAGPCFTCFGVAAILILPTTFEDAGSSTRWQKPVYSVSAVHLPSSITCTSWSVSYSTTPSGMYGMKLNRRESAATPSGPAKPGDQSGLTKLAP